MWYRCTWRCHYRSHSLCTRNAVIPSDIRQVDRESDPTLHRGLMRSPVVRSETSGLDKSEDDKLLTAPSLRCCISSLIFASSSAESTAKHEETAVAFWHDLRVNLCANDCRSWGKTLDAHSLSSHSAALSPSNPTISVLTRLSLADSRDIRQ